MFNLSIKCYRKRDLKRKRIERPQTAGTITCPYTDAPKIVVYDFVDSIEWLRGSKVDVYNSVFRVFFFCNLNVGTRARNWYGDYA